MLLESSCIKQYNRILIIAVFMMVLCWLLNEKPITAQEIEQNTPSSELHEDVTINENTDAILEQTEKWFKDAIASFSVSEKNEVAPLLDETIDISLNQDNNTKFDEIIEWFKKGLASEPISVDIAQSSIVDEPSALSKVIHCFNRLLDSICNREEIEKIYKRIYKTCNLDIVFLDTCARLEMPAEVELNSIKDLRQNFRFVFPCTMMDFQSACATITPGLIKEEIWSPDYRSLVVVPEKLRMSTEYTLTLATATLNADGLPLKEAAVIHFTTFSPEPASVTMVTPFNNAVDVATGATIILHFSKDIIWDPDYSPASFSVYNESTMQYVPLCPITAYNKKTLALIPENDLDIESKYSVNILSGIKTYVEEVDEDQPEVASATFYFSTSY